MRWGKKPKQAPRQPLRVDMHSHLLAGLDDGAETLEQGVALAKGLAELGYQKLITTPHIMGDFYKNTPEGIRTALSKLREGLAAEGVQVEVEAAAEYYLDEWFLPRLKKPKDLLTFDENYLLVETSYLNAPAGIDQVLFEIQSAGLVPVIAHPERYTYLEGKIDRLVAWAERGAKLQVNINSFGGYYNRGAQKQAEALVKAGLVHFLGTDTHSERHVGHLKKSMSTKAYQDALSLPLLNADL